MAKMNSKIADNRKMGKHQADELRARILAAAEKLFLENGIETTSMADISSLLGISRVTMYRYFASRDEIAVEIHVRMLEKINSIPSLEGHRSTLDSYRNGVRLILHNYMSLREAYRYIGMFDGIYLDKAPDNALTQWTKERLMNGALSVRPAGRGAPQLREFENQLDIILNTFTWSLEKLALRGEFTWADPPIPLEKQLEFFEKMIMRSFDLLEQSGDMQDFPE